MNRIKLISTIVVFLIMMIGASGCDMKSTINPETTDDEVLLSERQKKILSEQGLTTDYQKLLPSQKKSIVAIGEMLKYAENKYDIPFEYAGYIKRSTIESAQLRAYPAFGDKEKCFTITSAGEGYKDDYIAIYSAELFTNYVQNGIQALCPESTVKVFTEITYTSLDKIPDDSGDFDGTTEAAIWVFCGDNDYAENSFYDLVEEVQCYFEEHKIYSAVQVIFMKTDKIKYVTNSNFEDYLSDEHYEARETIYIKK